MNADRLLALYEKVAEAPDAIARLRRFVLDLAVRGKLVPQDAGDEPASELLKRIAAEKARLVKAGEIRKPKALPPLDDEPFDLPSNWRWVRIREVTSDRGQRVPDSNFTYIDVTAINKEAGIVAEPNVLTEDEAPSRARKIAAKDDVLYSCVRPYLLNVAILDKDFDPAPIASTAFAVLNGHGLVLPRYLWIALRSPFMVECVEENQRGQAYPAINDADFAVLPFPLPPHAEQRRIVLKVEELMALLDRLEAARTAREATRDRLTAASLARLTEPDADPVDFPANARFALATLPALTTRPDQIKPLRQTILNLAVQGKLEPFSAEKDLAEQFLALRESRISACLNASEKIKVVSAFEQIEAQWREEPDAPRFVTTLCACRFITKGTTPAPNDLLKTGHVPFLKVYNIVDNKLDFAYRPTFISPVVHNGALARSIVRPGDVLMNIVGPPLGKVALVTDEYPEWNINQALAYFRPMPLFSSRFLALILAAPVTIQEVLKDTRGTVGQDNLSLEQVRSLKIPFVSEVQQHRIVAKVDALMALCDRLEAALTTADTTRARLLEALLHEALDPAASLASEAAE